MYEKPVGNLINDDLIIIDDTNDTVSMKNQLFVSKERVNACEVFFFVFLVAKEIC